MTPVYIQDVSLPPVNYKEALRYAACKQADERTLELLHSCIAETQGILLSRVCWCVADVSFFEDGCRIGHISLPSLDLQKNLHSCSQAIVFGATLGTALDRLITKYGHLSPARALMLQGLGTERIETLCDNFCNSICTQHGISLRPRFSPGYGDLGLDGQKDIFQMLDCPKNIGLHLTQSLLMTPSKSVTAIAGIGKSCETSNKCSLCKKTDCLFRRSV